jgi:hypothetical protein
LHKAADFGKSSYDFPPLTFRVISAAHARSFRVVGNSEIASKPDDANLQPNQPQRPPSASQLLELAIQIRNVADLRIRFQPLR